MSAPTLVHATTAEALDIGLDGGVLAANGHAEATYHTAPGEPQRDDAPYTFPGTNFVFVHHLGMRSRRIDWWGDVRVSASGLVTLRANRDAALFASGVWTFIDDDTASYAGCLIRSFALGGKRRMQQRGNLIWILDYRIVLEQLEP